ncbi:ribosomal protein S9 [Turneriella parva DSM 21527]|uniref:Small ribosomal subunit protein uS9 n=2 Tax=Turneriella TaxID=338321 RepID=I4B461_TURPD|nr:ribosomal protein S9 [Turneriella parva DSM 21527]
MEKPQERRPAAPTLAESMTKRKAALKPAGAEAQVRRERKTTDQFVGRRKTAVARVSLKPGSGKITINNRDINEYFPRPDLRAAVLAPLVVTERVGQIDVNVNVYGGGVAGQAQAVSLGIARSIDRADNTQHTKLKAAGLLRRDPRMVERKKYGLHKARRATQFSKR